jgi:proteasome lid subunit RPN8/RPN11
MALELDGALQERLRQWALQGYPQECCGLLLGSAADGGVRVAEVTSARNLNTERAQDRFELDPQDFLRADALARERGLEIVGVWHTHPDHPAVPSATDLESAWEGWSYLILSVAAPGVQAMRSWRLAGREFVEEHIA